MARRDTLNRTGISRIENIAVHDAWIGYQCVQCGDTNTVGIGQKLLAPDDAYTNAKWICGRCGYAHSCTSNLPEWANWPRECRKHTSMSAQRFWQGFFRIATEHPESYWKQCNVCGRVQPFAAFSKHTDWGPLERQMECRGCKGAINAVLNPKRTKQQLHESAARRRVADLLLEGENERLSLEDLFRRFDRRCFKTGQPLDMAARETWAVDHILPSKYLYPLTVSNACLLGAEANQAKKARWPSEFYTASELVRLAKITEADLNLLASREPIVNPNIDVDRCVSRLLAVREKTDVAKRLKELKALLTDYDLVGKLSRTNRRMLGL